MTFHELYKGLSNYFDFNYSLSNTNAFYWVFKEKSALRLEVLFSEDTNVSSTQEIGYDITFIFTFANMKKKQISICPTQTIALGEIIKNTSRDLQLEILLSDI
jgi:hypothetical protein